MIIKKCILGQMLNKKHMYIDTKAEILWKIGLIDEALVKIQKCLAFSSNDKYYKEQFEKFNRENS